MRPKQVQEHTDAIRSALQDGPLFQVSSCQPNHSVLLYMLRLDVTIIYAGHQKEPYELGHTDVISMATEDGLLS